MSGYQILAIIAVAFVIGFGSAWRIESWRFESKEAAALAAQIAEHTKAEQAIAKIDTATLKERADYEGKITTLQQQVEAARKADHSKPCLVNPVLVRSINATSAR